jgi:G2/mitotic-specific cyclin 3/4
MMQILTMNHQQQPQRPLRALRIRDENQAPTAILAGKTIHQRNKSSPALTTLAQNGVAKAGVKRQAFADVSNIARPVNITKDDTALRGKSFAEPVKEMKLQDTAIARPGALLRPAQRPLSVAGIKGFLNNLTSSNAKSIVAEQQENPLPLPHANTAKTMSKKATQVFREPEPIAREPLVEQHPSINNVLARSNTNFSQNQYETIEPVQQLQKVVSNHMDYRQDVAPQVLLPEYHDARSDGVRLYEAASLPEINTDMPSFFEPLEEMYEDAVAHNVQPQELVHPAIQQQHQQEFESHHQPMSEVEGFYDEEVYDDQYDEEGYTTARSMRSRGDYTTGATTVVLAPRVTAKVEQELAEAREVMAHIKMANEQEDDESWDTSMVAEYGDEIFEYMRKLEVGSFRLSNDITCANILFRTA